jgi:phosphoribosylformimino-5-aminoimidazole carboxamide ribotide isomerase
MINHPFRVVPVLDLKQCRAVHAVGGRREHYQALTSVLHANSEPITLARSIRTVLGLETLYLADLDAIAGYPVNPILYQAISAQGLDLWLDAGVRDVRSLAPLLELSGAQTRLVVGLETVAGPRELAGIIDRAGSSQIIFSLDLFGGRPRMADPRAWSVDEPFALASTAIACGVRQLLVLDLSRIGTGQGPGTQHLLAEIRQTAPDVAVSVGGGISCYEEIWELKEAGAAAVLVGSAIHDGRIGRQELARI